MPVSRRQTFALLALALAGCTSPRVDGAPALAPSAPPPTQSAAQAKAASAVAALREAVARETVTAWSEAAHAQLEAILARLTVPDPLSDADQESFALPDSPTPTDLATTADAAAAALETAASEENGGALRLTYCSAAAAATGLRSVGVPPREGSVSPQPLPVIALEASLVVALGHIWALIYGLGIALGRLDSADATHQAAVLRLAGASDQRNELRDAIGKDVGPQPPSFTLPTTMDSPETIRAGLAELELNALAGYARLVAADSNTLWRQRMIAQVDHVHLFGGSLPRWPGWT